MKARILLLPGDGIGPEIVEQAARVLTAVGQRHGHDFELETRRVGAAALATEKVPISEETMHAAKAADAILLGAVGSPDWDAPELPAHPEDALFRLRSELGLFTNLRPVRPYPTLVDCSPLRPERLAGVDLLIVRELTGGLYFGVPRHRERTSQGWQAVDTLTYTEAEIRRVVEPAFVAARGRNKKVTSVDKANVLESSRLWRQIVTEIGARYPDVTLEHQLVDSCAMRLVAQPASFDVIVTENLFGDILSDEAAVICGSLGLLGSASLGESKRGLYEPIHGSAPDIAGQGLANPIGTILSAALLLRHSLGLAREAAGIEHAVERALQDGVRTRDLSRENWVTTTAMGSAILERLAD